LEKVLFFLLVIGSVVVVSVQDSFAVERAVNFKLRGVDGKTYELKELAKQAKAILLNFWEVNCKPCQKEMPEIVRLFKTYEPAGLKLVLISRDTELTVSRVAPMVASQKWDFPVLLDTELKVSQMYNVKFSPVNILISNKGEILFRLNGYKAGNEKEIEEAIIKALKLSKQKVDELKEKYKKSNEKEADEGSTAKEKQAEMVKDK